MSITPAAADLLRRDVSAHEFGIELVAAAAGGATVTMRVRPDMCNGFGIMHGGMTFLLADSAMAFASNAALDEGSAALASSAEIDWVAPVSVDDELVAVAERRWNSSRSSLWDITVSRRSESGFETVALVRGRTRVTRRQAPGSNSSDSSD